MYSGCLRAAEMKHLRVTVLPLFTYISGPPAMWTRGAGGGRRRIAKLSMAAAI